MCATGTLRDLARACATLDIWAREGFCPSAALILFWLFFPRCIGSAHFVEGDCVSGLNIGPPESNHFSLCTSALPRAGADGVDEGQTHAGKVSLGFALNLKHEGNTGFKSGEDRIRLFLVELVKQPFGV